MMPSTIHHAHDTLWNIQPPTPSLINSLQTVQANAPLNVPVSFAPWDEIAQVLGNLHTENPQMEHKDRSLWFLQFALHTENRIWWSYFHERSELLTCLTQLTHAFPCLKPISLESCQHGLRVCSHTFSASSIRQQRTDALHPHTVSQRDQQLFPLAPFASDYLTSFLKGLGIFTPCPQCQPNSPQSPINALLAP